MSLKWFGDKVMAAFRSDERDRVTRAAIVLSRYAKIKMSEKDNLRGSNPSARGEYPAKVTGNLVTHVVWEDDEDEFGALARWGTNVVYGRTLEVFQGRKWMSMTNAEKLIEVKAILGGRLA